MTTHPSSEKMHDGASSADPADAPRRITTFRDRFKRDSFIGVAITCVLVLVAVIMLMSAIGAMKPMPLPFPLPKPNAAGVIVIPQPVTNDGPMVRASIAMGLALGSFGVFIVVQIVHWQRAYRRAKSLGWMSCPNCQYELPREGSHPAEDGLHIAKCPECALCMSVGQIRDHWDVQAAHTNTVFNETGEIGSVDTLRGRMLRVRRTGLIAFSTPTILAWISMLTVPILSSTVFPGRGSVSMYYFLVPMVFFSFGHLVFMIPHAQRWKRAFARAKQLGWMSCPVCQHELSKDGATSLHTDGMVVVECPTCRLRMTARQIRKHWTAPGLPMVRATDA